MITIGIDPDMIASGVAVTTGKTISRLQSVKLPNLIATIQAIGSPGEVVIKLENPEANGSVFGRDLNGAVNKRAVRDAIAMRVGKVMATTHHVHEMLVAAGYEVRLIKPLSGPIKRQAKTDAAYFNKVTGWTGRSNQDQRDAALIALWG